MNTRDISTRLEGTLTGLTVVSLGEPVSTIERSVGECHASTRDALRFGERGGKKILSCTCARAPRALRR